VANVFIQLIGIGHVSTSKVDGCISVDHAELQTHTSAVWAQPRESKTSASVARRSACECVSKIDLTRLNILCESVDALNRDGTRQRSALSPSPLHLSYVVQSAFVEHALVAIWSRRVDAVDADAREHSMSKATLDNRHRNKDGEISAKHGNTLIRTLRKVYGQTFAAGYPETEKLREVLLKLNETSLSQLRRDHETGHLEHKISKASK
jgi:hypothetical protein